MAQVGSSNEGRYARQQLGEIEWFSEVIVRATFEAADSRFQLIARRQQEYWRRDTSASQLLDYRESVATRKHDVEHHAVIFAGQRALDSPVARIGLVNVVTFLAKGLSQEAPKVPIVLDK